LRHLLHRPLKSATGTGKAPTNNVLILSSVTNEPSTALSQDNPTQCLKYTDAVKMVSKAIGDAERRGRNVIITGVPEDSSASPDERQFLTNMFHNNLRFDLSRHVVSSKQASWSAFTQS